MFSQDLTLRERIPRIYEDPRAFARIRSKNPTLYGIYLHMAQHFVRREILELARHQGQLGKIQSAINYRARYPFIKALVDNQNGLTVNQVAEITKKDVETAKENLERFFDIALVKKEQIAGEEIYLFPEENLQLLYQIYGSPEAPEMALKEDFDPNKEYEKMLADIEKEDRLSP